MPLETIAVAVISATAAGGLAYFFSQKKSTETKESHPDTSQITNQAKNDAKQIVLEAKDQAIKIKESAERETKEERDKLQKRMDEIYNKTKEFETKERDLRSMQDKAHSKLKQIEQTRQEQITKLEKVASMTKKEAQETILSNLEKSLKPEIAKRIKEAEEQIQKEVNQKTRELLVDAMQHASTDYVAEYTISTVKLPDEDIKGRIIGKEGRNIRAFEDATGVNVDFENESEVRLSSFDSVRREVARIAMEELIKDGRIHPARIEEIVQKIKIEVDKVILEAGEKLCQTVGVYNLPKELVKKLGNFKFRTSYGQNMIQHTLEETKMGVKIANEIGADVAITKLACLLHDIGKVVTDKEGNHIELGVEYLKGFNLPKSVLTAVAEHHQDSPSTVEGVIVQIADSISGSRPGARYEDYENFVKRMKALEDAAMSFEGVAKAFAISAGRELRVIVKAEDVDDDTAVKLSHDIAKKVETEQTFPGTVKVVVIRELRSVSTAS